MDSNHRSTAFYTSRFDPRLLAFRAGKAVSFLRGTEGSKSAAPSHRRLRSMVRTSARRRRPGVTRMLMTNKLLCSNKATGPRVTSNLLQILN